MPDILQDILVFLAWTAAVCLVLALIGWLTLKWIAVRIARHVAEIAEERMAATIQGGLTRTGIRIEGAHDEALRARYVADIDRMAWLMDDVIRLPIVGGVGLDAVLGLVPVAGDAISFAISSFIIIRAAQLGVPEALISRLIAIHITDLLLGAIPVAGDLFDAAYHADQKSAALVREWMSTRRSAVGIPPTVA